MAWTPGHSTARLVTFFPSQELRSSVSREESASFFSLGIGEQQSNSSSVSVYVLVSVYGS
jgi:hypothetical protein